MKYKKPEKSQMRLSGFFRIIEWFSIQKCEEKEL